MWHLLESLTNEHVFFHVEISDALQDFIIICDLDIEFEYISFNCAAFVKTLIFKYFCESLFCCREDVYSILFHPHCMSRRCC